MPANKQPTVSITEHAGWYHVWVDGRLYSTLNDADVQAIIRAYLEQGNTKGVRALLKEFGE